MHTVSPGNRTIAGRALPWTALDVHFEAAWRRGKKKEKERGVVSPSGSARLRSASYIQTSRGRPGPTPATRSRTADGHVGEQASDVGSPGTWPPNVNKVRW